MHWTKKIKCGKYNGQTYEYVAITDPRYWAWMMTKANFAHRWKRKAEKLFETSDFTSEGP